MPHRPRHRSILPPWPAALVLLLLTPSLAAVELPFGAELVVDGALAGARLLVASDIDRDGDSDLVAAAREDDDVVWFENALGDGSSWIRHAASSRGSLSQVPGEAVLVGSLEIGGSPESVFVSGRYAPANSSQARPPGGRAATSEDPFHEIPLSLHRPGGRHDDHPSRFGRDRHHRLGHS